jgi:hypothetical protein
MKAPRILAVLFLLSPVVLHADSAVSLPFKTVGGAPLIECAVNGVSHRCLVDTGAERTVVDSKLKLAKIGSSSVYAIGGSQDVIVAEATIQVSGQGVSQSVFETDLHASGYEVILGADFFQKFHCVTIDYTNHVVTFGGDR